jgi:hypothetical protein
MRTNLRAFTSHDKGDTVLRFVFEPDTNVLELIKKFGDPEIEVGGTWLSSATLGAPTIVSGAITAVPVTFIGDTNAYSAQRPIIVEAVDPAGTGSGATFTAVMNGSGKITSITVNSGGTNYSAGTTVRIASGGHQTTFPNQKVKLLAGFPFTRRISTIEPGDLSLEQLVMDYRGFISSNVQTALTNLRALDNNTTDLTSEVVYQP